MLWFWIVISAQFANAGALLLDKFLLSSKFPRPVVLTFWTALWNLLGLVFIFWDFIWFPGWYVLILALVSGLAFTIALQFLYMGMKEGEASHISPLVGGVVPVVTMIITYFWLSQRLTGMEYAAVLLLVLGSFLISFEKSLKHNGLHIGMLWGVIAGIFFGGSYALIEGVFAETTFSTGFVWARVGSFVPVIFFLLLKSVRKDIFVKSEKKKKQMKSGLVILVINKSLAAVYFLGMNFAISIAGATIVNALAGLQYAILFVLIFASTKLFPKFFKEKFTRMEIVQQVVAIVLIIGGLALIAL
jgi:drug/metabolite transporter (DMT)-like permease